MKLNNIEISTIVPSNSVVCIYLSFFILFLSDLWLMHSIIFDHCMELMCGLISAAADVPASAFCLWFFLRMVGECTHINLQKKKEIYSNYRPQSKWKRIIIKIIIFLFQFFFSFFFVDITFKLWCQILSMLIEGCDRSWGKKNDEIAQTFNNFNRKFTIS